MNPTNFCNNCGKRFSDHDQKCVECGSSREQAGMYSGADDAANDLRHSRSEFRKASDHAEALSHNDARSVPLATWEKRILAYLINFFLSMLLTSIPVIGLFASLAFTFWTWTLNRRGLDIGAKVIGLRVVRDNGELAGFFHMYTRQLASMISLIALGAGYWTAFSDPRRQTWHDKMMGTYVVRDSQNLLDVPGTSSQAAKLWFWVSVVFIVVLVALWGSLWGYSNVFISEKTSQAATAQKATTESIIAPIAAPINFFDARSSVLLFVADDFLERWTAKKEDLAIESKHVDPTTFSGKSITITTEIPESKADIQAAFFTEKLNKRQL